MEKVFETEEQCYGCSACRNICPCNVITMEEDNEGFRYPIINKELCVDCGLCRKVCPYYAQLQMNGEQCYYAVKHKDAEVVENSSSGGVFTALSDAVLNVGGVIYGVLLNAEFKVVHSRAITREERDTLRGSKYVQSDMGVIMQQIAEDIKADRQVMFTGTPCQVAGVRSFIEEKGLRRDKLLLCDFICHGTTSPKVWKAYVDFFKTKYDSGLQKYFFRGKKEGWSKWYPIIYVDNNDLSEQYRYKNSYLLLYQTCYLNRSSCYSCKFTSYDRASDITFADFWNIKAVNSKMDDDRGTSQVLVNTKIGKRWFIECTGEMVCAECTRKDVWQPHLEYPNAKPGKRDVFWNDFAKKDFTEVLKKYGQGDWLTKCKNWATPILKKTGLYVFIGKLYRVIFVHKGRTDGQ